MKLHITLKRVVITSISLIIIGFCIYQIRQEIVEITQLKREAMETSKLLQTRKSTDNLEIESEKIQNNIKTSESTSQQLDKLVAKTNNEFDNSSLTPEKLLTDSTKEDTENTELFTSPFGFGPYPEVPEGMLDVVGNPYEPIWKHPKWPDGIGLPRQAELLSRVVIKAWKEDLHRDYSGCSTKGDCIVYFNYPNTIYVWYGKPIEEDDGSITIPFKQVKGMTMSKEQMRYGIVPDNVRVLDGETEGIDAYEYLDL